MKHRLQTFLRHKLQWLALLTAMLTVSQGVWSRDFSAGERIYVDATACSWYENDGYRASIYLMGTNNIGPVHMNRLSDRFYYYEFKSTATITEAKVFRQHPNDSGWNNEKNGIQKTFANISFGDTNNELIINSNSDNMSAGTYTPSCTEPTVTSNAASNITQNSATISGQYSGTCPDCGTPTFTVSGGTLGSVTESSGVYSATVTGLSAGTQYSFTFDVPNSCASSGTTSSTSRNFTTCTRTFDGSEYLYIDTGACSWFGSNQGVPALSFDGGSNYANADLLSGKIYRILVPSGCYDEFILRRHCDNGDWDAHTISFAGTSGKNQFNVYSNWSGESTKSTWTVYNSSSITIRISKTENMPFTPDKIYYWYNNGAGDVMLSAAWRGDDLGDDGTYYKAITVPAGHLKMIVSDGSHQTVNMTISDVTTSNTFCFKILSNTDGSGHYNYETADCCPTPTVSFSSGSATVCTGQTSVTYSVTADAGTGKTISRYTWTVPSGWSITSGGSETESITVTVGSTTGNQTVKCQVTNSCNKTSEEASYSVTVRGGAGVSSVTTPTFDNVEVGQSGTKKDFSFEYYCGYSVTTSDITLTGTNRTEFSLSDLSVSDGTISGKVTFSPTSAGAKTAEISVNNGDATINLSATAFVEAPLWAVRTGGNSYSFDANGDCSITIASQGKKTFDLYKSSTSTVKGKNEVMIVPGQSTTIDGSDENTSEWWAYAGTYKFHFDGLDGSGNPKVTVTYAPSALTISDPTDHTNIYIKGPLEGNGCWPGFDNTQMSLSNNVYTKTFIAYKKNDCNARSEFVLAFDKNDDYVLERRFIFEKDGENAGWDYGTRTGDHGEKANFNCTLSYDAGDELVLTVTWNPTSQRYKMKIAHNCDVPYSGYLTLNNRTICKGNSVTATLSEYTSTDTGISWYSDASGSWSVIGGQTGTTLTQSPTVDIQYLARITSTVPKCTDVYSETTPAAVKVNDRSVTDKIIPEFTITSYGGSQTRTFVVNKLCGVTGELKPKFTGAGTTDDTSGDFTISNRKSDDNTISFDVTFTPSSTGEKTADLKIVYKDGSDNDAEWTKTITASSECASISPSESITAYTPVTVTGNENSVWVVSTDPSYGVAWLSVTSGVSTVFKAPYSATAYVVKDTYRDCTVSITVGEDSENCP